MRPKRETFKPKASHDEEKTSFFNEAIPEKGSYAVSKNHFLQTQFQYQGIGQNKIL